MKRLLTCSSCGKEFVRDVDSTRMARNKNFFCSKECYKLWWHGNVDFTKPQRRVPQTATCKGCGKTFSRIQEAADTMQYCSQECYQAQPKRCGVLSICEQCHTEFWRECGARSYRFCTHKCYAQWLSVNIRGERHPNYLDGGGREGEMKRLRSTPEYSIWRQFVLDRDNHECVICHSDLDVVAHHIKSFTENPEVRFAIENGITLCRSHHGVIHGDPQRLIRQPRENVKIESDLYSDVEKSAEMTDSLKN